MKARIVWIALFLIAIPLAAAAQQFEFPPAAAQDESALARALPTLATQVITAYTESDRDRYLDNLWRLQMTEGKYAEAESTIRSLSAQRRASNLSRAADSLGPYQIYAHAKARQAATGWSKLCRLVRPE